MAIELPKPERLRWNDAVALLLKAADQGGGFSRAGEIRQRAAWGVGRWSAAYASGQERGMEAKRAGRKKK
jgi:hypothetical protein